jgi:hypothetical protein
MDAGTDVGGICGMDVNVDTWYVWFDGDVGLWVGIRVGILFDVVCMATTM